MKKFLLFVGMIILSASLFGQTTLISPTGDGGFETGGTFPANGWTAINGANNNWYVGNAPVVASGVNCAFSGTNSTTWTGEAFSNVNHIYKDVAIPAGESQLTFAFKYKINAPDATYDYLKVYLVPTSTTPVAGTQLASGQIGAAAGYDSQTTWTTITFNTTASAGTTQRVVFSWRTDGASPHAAVALDDISVVSQAPPPPLTGIKTIDPAGSGPNNYVSFTLAITDLNTKGVGAGGVTFNVAAGNTFTEDPPAINATGTAANPIVFQRNGAGTNPKIAGTGGAGSSDAALIIAGGDYFTFDGIDISSTAATLEYGYLIRNASAIDGAQYNTIKNAKITLNRTNLLTVGIMQSSSTSYGGGTTPSANSGNNSYNKYYNMTIENSYSGIWLYSYSLTYFDLGNEIGTTGTGSTTIGAATANDIGNGTSAVYGIYAYYQNSLKVFNTEIRNLTGTGTAYVYGLYSNYDQGNSLFYNNKIHDISTTNTTTSPSLYGIYVYYPTLTTSVYNNVVYGFSHALSTASATQVAFGINITGTTTASVYYNSVRMNLSANVTNSAFYNGITNCTAKNNIFSNFSTAGATSKRFCFYASSTPVSTSNNILYIDGTGTNNFVGYGAAADRASLQVFAAAISPAAPSYGFFGGSCNADPNFTAATDLTFAGSTPARYSGTPVTGITSDINGTTRDLTRPTIGAYETTQALNDKSAPVFSNISVTNGTSPVVSVTLTDNSNSALNSTIRLWYRLSTSVGAFTALDADSKPAGAMNGTYTWNTSIAALAQGTYQFFIAARDDQGAGLGIWTYPMWASTWLGWAAGDPPNFIANPDVAANTVTIVKQGNLAAGTYEVGDDQPILKKLTDVAAQLNSSILQGNVTFELNSTYDGTTGELFPIVFNQYSTTGGSWTATIRVKTGVTARTTSGNVAFPLVRLDGADNITFDGRAGGTGSTVAWNIKNTNVGGNDFTFINDAQSNTIQYCDLVAVNNTTSLGVVIFGTTTGVNGNDNNTVSYCNIHDDGTNFPLYGIYSAGTTTTLNTWNSGITISNCNIYNFYINGGNPVGIYLAAASTGWTVTGNSFYQTSTRTPTTATGFNIMLLGTGDGHTVTGNYLGGSGPLCAGTWTISGTTVANFIYGIRFGSLLLTNANSVQGNTISNISLGVNPASAGTIVFDAMLLAGGVNNIGNITPNTIGSGSATGSIVVTLGAGAFASNVIGLDVRGPSGVIQNNIIGGITVSGTTTSSCTVSGIYFPPVLGGDYIISGNTVGSSTTANSIQAPSSANPPIMMIGIYSLPQGGYGNVSMTNNTIANFTNNSTSTTAYIYGIRNANSWAPTTISQNTIRDLLCTAPNTNATTTASIIGLYSSNTFAGQVMKQNTFYNFSNTTATAAAVITGIYYTGPTTGTNLFERNFIHSFSLSSTSTTATLNGIYCAGGLTTFKNNLIRLGINSAGSGLTVGYPINGIYESGGINNYYNNSVYVGGTGVTGTTGSTYAFYSTVTSSARNIVDNIFFNARSGGTTGKHYAIRVAGTGYNPAGLYSNYNLLLANGATGGTLGYYGADMATIAAWKAATGQDMASGNGDPNFINATGTSALVDLHVQSPTPIEAAGVALSAVTDDYDGQTRSSLTPPDIGADAGNFTASADIFGPNITFTPLGNGGTANRILNNFATITDNVGVASGANVPRLYYKKSTDNNAFVGNTNADNGWKYVLASNTSSPYSFTIDYGIINGGFVLPTNIIQYFVVAQDVANNLSSNIEGAAASGNPPVTLINAAPASPNSFVIGSSIIFGTVTVPGTYPTLTGAGGLFEAINNGIVTSNVTANITADLVEPGTVALNQFSESPLNSNFTLTIQPDGTTERLISGAVANGMIRLDGADRVSFDGRFNYSGRYLRFRNTNTSNPTFTFLNDATNNTIRNCYIEGANTGSSSGVIVLSTTSGLLGNSNNTITSNIIRDRSDAAGVPYTLIYSSGTTAKENASLTISGNELFNFTNYGIYLTSTGNGDGMNISNNSIYQTASRTSTFYGINVSAGNGHTISGNSFGGSNASRTGAATQTTGAYGMYGIYLSVGMVTPTSVQGNMLSNFGSTGSGSGSNVWGLYIASGNVNVGTVTGNTFGGGALPSDTIRNGYDNGIIYSASTGYINVENNVVGNVAYYNASGDRTCGIYLSSGIISLKNNIIRDIKSNSTSTGLSYLPIGVYISSTAPCNVEGNNIYNITNSNPGTSAYTSAGLIIAGAWTNSTIQKNSIYNIKAIGTGTSTNSPQVYGMYISAGNATYYNNLISLGLGTDGESRLYGIQDLSTGINNYYYNSINLYGTGAGSNSSYAFLKSAASIVTLRNNILNNARTGGTIKPYAIGASSVVGVSSNNNDLYSSSGPLGLWGAVDQSNLAAWQSASFGDAASVSANPNFVSNTNLHTCQSALNGAGVAVSGITTDYAGVTRGNPPDIGAYEVSIPVPTITGGTTLCQNSTGNVYTTESGMTGYAWSVTGGTITSGGTSTDNTATITWTASGAQSVSVNYFNSSGCAASTPTVKNVTIDPVSVGGSIAGSTNVCTGTNSTLLTLSGHIGSITKWQYSTDNWVTPVDIANTATTYTATNLTTTTKFRAVITSGVCSSANSSDATVTVDPVTVGGSIAGAATVCSGTNSTLLTLSGNTGAVVKWQSSVDNWVTPVDIANAATTYTATNLTATTKFRAVVQSGACSSANSSDVTVTVNPVSVGGLIGGSATVCSGTNSTLLSLSGYTGTITKWQYSTDNWVTPVDIVNTTNTYTATNVTTTTKYRAVITSGVCSSANSAEATVTVDPVSVGGTIAGSTTVCTGTNSTLLTLSGYTGSITKWQYSVDNWVTPIDIANTTNTYTATNLTNSTKYRAVVTSGVCSSTNSGEAQILVNLASAGGSIAGSASVCSGTNSTLLTLSGQTGGIIKWQYSTDNWVTPVDIVNTSTTYTATNLTTTTKYRAVVQSGVCPSANSSEATVTVNPLPVPTVSGPSTCFSGTSGNIYSTEAGMTSYVWTISAGGTIDAGQGTASISVSWNATGAQNVSVTYTNGNSCSAATPTIYPVSVTALPGPAGPITGTATVCQNQNGVAYSVAPIINATGYVWTLPTGATIATGSNTNSITVNYSTTAVSGNITVYGTNALGNGTVSPNYAVTVNTMPTPTITGNNLLCAGSTGITYSTEAGMSSYAWTVSTGGVITAGTGTNQITVTWNTAGSKTVTVNYNNANGCSAATPTSYSVTVNAQPVPTITGNSSLCVNTMGVIYSTEAGMTGYTWAISSGGTITAGAGTNTVTVNWTSAGAQTISVTYTNSNSCSAATPTVYNVTVNPLPGPTITGNANTCIGQSYTYSTEASMTGYNWVVSAGGTITSGAGTNSIVVQWNTLGGQSVSVNYTNGNGCTASVPTGKTVTVNALPVPTISGPASACATSVGNVYTTQASMTGYTWTVSAGGTITAGAGTNAITVTWNTAGAQSVSVNYNNSNGCTAVSPTSYAVTVNTLPVPTIAGPASVCAGTTGSTYTTEAGMNTYSWSVSAGGTIVLASGNTAIVTWNTAGAQWVKVNYFNGNGCTATTATQYDVTVNPLPVPTISGSASVCVNSTGNVYTTQAGMTNYLWSVSPGGVVTSGGLSTNNTVTVTWNTTGAQWVKVNYTNGNGCTATAQTQYNVTVNPLPVPTITGAASACVGSTGNIYSTEASMTGYNWVISGGGTITAGAGTNTVTVTWGTVGAQTLSVNYINGNGCTAASSTVKNVTVNALPVPTITGAASACAGTTGVIYSTEASMTGYTWVISAGGVITAGAGTNTVTVTWNTAGAQTLSVNYNNANGCTAAAATVKNVTVNALPVPTITGPASACVNSTGNVYTTQAGMTGYNWVISAGGTITAGTGTNSVTVTWNTVGARTLSVNYANANGCTAAAATVYNITVNALPVPTIAGPTAMCAGTAGNVYTTQAGMTGYTWAVTGGTITAGAGTSSITVTWTTAGAQTVSVNYNNANGCSAAAPTIYNVTVNPLPVPVISGPSAVCINSAGNVYTTQTGMSNYVWTVSAGGTVTAGGTATSNFVTVTWTTAGPKTVTVNYANAFGCTASASTVYNVTVSPLPVPTITGPTSVCSGAGYATYVTETGNSSYVWSVSAGGSIVSGQGTSALTVYWSTAGAQWVKVNYSSPGGCTAVNPTQLDVTVTTVPGAAGAITGSAAVCAGASGVSYSVAPVANALSYAWTLPAGATIVTGQYTNSITVNFATNASSGTITVAGNNLCGNGATSPAFAVTVNGLPAAAGSITGSASVCQGSNGIVYSVPAIANATGYTWSMPSGATIASGANTNSITVNFSMTAASGNVTVFGTNSCGVGTVSPSYAVTVNAKPSKPTVTASGNTLTSSAASGNQWYWNGTAVAGATSQVYTVPAANPGWYWTIVTLNGCSSDSSNHVYVAGVGIVDNTTLSFNVYPVPNNGIFTAEVSSAYEESFRIQIYNTLGAMVYKTSEFKVMGTHKETIDVQNLPAGIYSVVFMNEQRKVVRKVFINK